MAVNVVREYKRLYIEERRKRSDIDTAHSEAISKISRQLLQDSAQNNSPVTKRDLAMLRDIETNPHFKMLLEDILDKTEEEQKEYLRAAAKVPMLKLVK